MTSFDSLVRGSRFTLVAVVVLVFLCSVRWRGNDGYSASVVAATNESELAVARQIDGPSSSSFLRRALMDSRNRANRGTARRGRRRKRRKKSQKSKKKKKKVVSRDDEGDDDEIVTQDDVDEDDVESTVDATTNEEPNNGFVDDESTTNAEEDTMEKSDEEEEEEEEEDETTSTTTNVAAAADDDDARSFLPTKRPTTSSLVDAIEDETTSPSRRKGRRRPRQQAMMADLRRYPGSLSPLRANGRVVVRLDDDDASPAVGRRALVELRDVRGAEPNCRGCVARLLRGTDCRSIPDHDDDRIATTKTTTTTIPAIPWFLYDADEEGVVRAQAVVAVATSDDVDALPRDVERARRLVALYDANGRGSLCGGLRAGRTTDDARTLAATLVGPSRARTRATMVFGGSSMVWEIAGSDPCGERPGGCRVATTNETSCALLDDDDDDNDARAESFDDDDDVTTTTSVPRDLPFHVLYQTLYPEGGHTNAATAFFHNVTDDLFSLVARAIYLVDATTNTTMACGILRSERTDHSPHHLAATMADHPDNVGPGTPDGDVVLDWSDDDDDIVVSLDVGDLDNDRRCDHTNSTANNCTVSLYHLSTSCRDDHDQLRPWFTGAYSTVDGHTFSSFRVPWDDLDRSLSFDPYRLLGTIVVLRQHGRNVGCGPLRPARRRPYHESLSAVMGSFPGRENGPLRPEGTVDVVVRDDDDAETTAPSLVVSLRVDGLERLCRDCALRVRAGTSCDDARSIGAPYVLDASFADAYVNATYDSVGGATLTTARRPIVLRNGHGLWDNAGRVVVLHGADGAPASCGVFRTDHRRRVDGDSLFGRVVRYGRYADRNARPRGTVRLRFLPNRRAVSLRVELTGGPPNCRDCRLRFRRATDCDGGARLGDVGMLSDVVRDVGYDTDEHGSGSTEAVLANVGGDAAATIWDLHGRVLHLFDPRNREAACARLLVGRRADGADRLVASVAEFFTFPGDSRPRGTVTLFRRRAADAADENLDADLISKHNLIGLPDDCAVTPASCRQHVHEFGDCRAPGPMTLNGFPNYRSTPPEGTSVRQNFVDRSGGRRRSNDEGGNENNENENNNNNNVAGNKESLEDYRDRAFFLKETTFEAAVACGVLRITRQMQTPEDFRRELLGRTASE